MDVQVYSTALSYDSKRGQLRFLLHCVDVQVYSVAVSNDSESGQLKF